MKEIPTIITDPKLVACPACNALGGMPCTTPTDTGRRPVAWVHNSRADLAKRWT